MAPRSTNVLRYASTDDLSQELVLRAGPLTATYLDGDLRTIRVGEREVLRRVYVAVRDRNWNTIPATLDNVTIEQSEDAFEIRYHALHREGDICFHWDALIRGAATGEITFVMDGIAWRSFLRNRIGICVLHPTEECAGVPCRVTHMDGSVTEGVLPRYISPHQPYKEIRGFAHEVTPGLWADVRFEGDVFEMEDQRNWTDASFKTYSTPLELPFPVRIEAGAQVRQSVTLTLQGDLAATSAALPADSVTVALGGIVRAQRPALGLGVASHGQPLTAIEIERLRALRLAHLRVDLESIQSAEQVLGLAADQAALLGASLEIGLPLGRFDGESPALLAGPLNRLNAPVARWLLLTDGVDSQKAAQAIAQARSVLEALTPQAQFVVGVNAYFTELNRTRPPLELAEMVCYSLNPQVHAFDNLSLVETLPAQAVTVESARQFIGGRPVVVSPVTLRPRFNPNATAPDASEPSGALPESVDPRQMSLFGAGWTLVSLKHLMSHPAVSSLTYYETSGWRGVMEQPQGAPAAAFPSRPGEAFPLYHVFRWIGACREAAIREVRSSHPVWVDGLALHAAGCLCIGLANLTNLEQRVELTGLDAPMRVALLDESTAEGAMADPEGWASAPRAQLARQAGSVTLDLAPFAVAWLRAETR